LRSRVCELLRGISDSFNCASKRSSGAASRSRAIALSRTRRGVICLVSLARRAFFSIELFLAMSGFETPQRINS